MKQFMFLLAALVSMNSWAGPGHEPVPMPKEFENMKKLIGTWTGTNKMEGKDVDVTVVYKLTSGGTAIEETMSPGTPHEMITVYHKDGKSVGMTHYCAIGNQPHMQLQKATDKSFAFEMKKPMGVASMKETHMHAVTLTMADDNSLTQEWTNYEDGKKKDTVTFALKRK